MKRLFVGVACVLIGTGTTVWAQPPFKKVWEKYYLEARDLPEEEQTEEYKKYEPSEDFKKLAKKEGCNLCHVKGAKKDVKNEYGEALSEDLNHDTFDKATLKLLDKGTDEEKADLEAKVIAAFKKAEAMESKDGRKYFEKIKAGELPAVVEEATEKKDEDEGDDD
jgi:hypothetical protein